MMSDDKSLVPPAGGDVETCVPVLRAMARNYRNGHSWDHLDGKAVTKAADEITRLQTEVERLYSVLKLNASLAADIRIERDALKAEVERLKAGPDHFCGGPMSVNPHADAGIPGRYLEVGATCECIPCLVKSRHDWANKANAMQSELTKARELLKQAMDSLFHGASDSITASEIHAFFMAHQSAPAAKCDHARKHHEHGGTQLRCSDCGQACGPAAKGS